MKIRTLRREAAQMVMPRIDGERLDDAKYLAGVQALVRDGIGGFILFGGSIEQTPSRLQGLQETAEIPLLIASDVERGLGQQLLGGTRFPNQRAVASAVNRRAKSDLKLLDGMLDAVRSETRAAGIHAVFSPVVDVNNNPDNPIICTRAFGDEPGIVEWFGSRYIKRLQRPAAKNRIDLLACAKHFPGHGDTDQDSHSVLPVIRADKARLNRVELPPFREAVKDGVAMVMVAHLMVPALDAADPTTFSKKTVTALLREGMAFEGLIVSDALDMGALAYAYAPEEIAVRAVEAGMDLLLHPLSAGATVDAVVSAVEQGRLTRQRIAESVDRIMAAKTKLGLFDKQRAGTARIDYEEHRRIALELGRRAPRVEYGDATLLPLDTGGVLSCFILDDDNNKESGSVFLEQMKKKFKHVSFHIMTPDAVPSAPSAQDAVIAANNVVVAIFSRISASKGRSGLSDSLCAAVDDILRAARTKGKKTITISFDSPYVLGRFKDADVRISAFDRMDEIQQAAAELIAGA